MSLIQWEPLRNLESMVDRYARSMGFPTTTTPDITATADWSPHVNICESDKSYLIEAEVPGMRKEDIKVNLEDGVLCIQGERKQEKVEKGKKFLRVEGSYGNFYRSFSLPDNIDETHIKATFHDGLLDLEIPKTTEAVHKTVQVKVE